jgi:protoporphyrin/coproporphyrin ferrochelatase
VIARPTAEHRDGVDASFDAFLVVSFGGPEQPADVMPFLRRVTGGRGIPDERLAEVATHYDHFGGRSPINDQNRALLAAVRDEFGVRGIDLPVYWGNRNWDPLLADELARIAADGHRRVAVFVTSAYSSYSGCRQYRENLAAAASEAGVGDRLEFVRLPHYWSHPGFVEPFADGLRDALATLPPGSATVFVTHSIPVTMNAASGPSGHAYTTQHAETARLVRAGAGLPEEPPALVFCSRSGPPSVPWLEPDVNAYLTDLAAAGVPGVAVVPIGFVSDHMEVRFDLDTEAADTAAALDVPFVRVATPGTDRRFVAAIVDMLSSTAPTSTSTRCAPGCCANPRGHRPALCGSD